MAYIGYETRVGIKPVRSRATGAVKPRSATGSRIAWARVAVIAGAILSWSGIIAAIRAAF